MIKRRLKIGGRLLKIVITASFSPLFFPINLSGRKTLKTRRDFMNPRFTSMKIMLARAETTIMKSRIFHGDFM